jgi:predicted metal-dependent hydrolase
MSAKRKAIPISPRRLSWDFSTTSTRHWFGGSPVLTHLLNVYTLLVPDNEAYYIRTLKPCLERLSDEGQRTDLLQFFRQESLHGLAHKAYWTQLDAQGFRFTGFVALVNLLLYRLFEPIQPHRLRMSIVAAIEHINAFWANIFLGGELLAAAEPRLRELFSWHFAEEIEHKAIAHDALRALYPGYVTRILGGAIAFPTFYLILACGTMYLLAQEGELLRRRTLRDLRAFFGARGVLKASLMHMARYFRPSFEPWELDDMDLAHPVLAAVPHREAPLRRRQAAA